MPLKPAQHGKYGADEVIGRLAVPIRPRHQVRRDLGIGVAGKLDTGSLQLPAQDGEVLDDAVVDDGDLAGSVAVRVRVAVGGTTVGGPAGVAQAGSSGQRRGRHFRHGFLEVGQPARTPAHGECATVDQRDARRVVAAVLHPAQRVHDDDVGGAPPDVTDNSAHSRPG
ncbi:Uncharacterised protein [Mycobacterium tuberculosis]|nr:Uncharacterised protein [Mycobacterium tuberculosis]